MGVSIQLISLASRELNRRLYDGTGAISVSIQLISLASRELTFNWGEVPTEKFPFN